MFFTLVSVEEQPDPHVKPKCNKVLEVPKPPVGEDGNSFKRHNKLLTNEYHKKVRNEAVVKDVMDVSYAMRRADILQNPENVKSILIRYPFLQEHDQVHVCIIILY